MSEGQWRDPFERLNGGQRKAVKRVGWAFGLWFAFCLVCSLVLLGLIGYALVELIQYLQRN